MIVVAAAYETTDPTVGSRVIGMKAAGAAVLVNTAMPKFAAQAIRKAAMPFGAPDAGAGAEAMRRQSDTREHHEEGGKLARFLRADAVARKHDQYEPHGLCPDQANSDGSFDGEQWRLFGQLTTGKVVG